MEKTTIADLKQELIDTIKGIDKDKLTIYDMKVLAETIGNLANIKENQTDYLDVLMKMTSNGFGSRPTTVSDLKGEK